MAVTTLNESEPEYNDELPRQYYRDLKWVSQFSNEKHWLWETQGLRLATRTERKEFGAKCNEVGYVKVRFNTRNAKYHRAYCPTYTIEEISKEEKR